MESNKLDVLASTLFNDLCNNKDFFKTKIVITKSKEMESYLKMYFLKNNLNILMNVKFVSGNNGLKSLFNTDYKLLNKKGLRNLIIKYLNSNNKLFKTYLDKKDESYSVKLFDISNEMANLFDDIDNDLKDNKYQDIYDYILKEANNNGYTTLRDLYNNAKLNLNYDYYSFGYFVLTKLEEAIFNKSNVKRYDIKYSVEKGMKVSLIKAPNKMREIEYLHSKICNILSSDKNIKLSDFLVVGSNIYSYENEISRVFNQDNISFPNIPYSINGIKSKNNNIYNVLMILKDIINKGFFTRKDFSDLLNNNVIKKIKELEESDINNIEESILLMNIYRKDDFLYAKKRLLLSKICDINQEDNKLSIENSIYIPFSKIGFDDNLIYKFISIVDNLYKLLDLFNTNKLLTKEVLEEFNIILDEFLSIKDINQIEVNSYYRLVVDTINFYKDFEIYNIPLNTFFDSLIGSSTSVSGSSSLFDSGITFTEFNPNIILGAKYLFFINASSIELPKKKVKNALDKDMIINYDNEKKAFNLYYENSENVFISFVYRNLKTDEEFFLSNFVKELEDYNIDSINGDEIEKNIDYISIDEKRKYEDIFTKKEKRNKEFFLNLDNINSIQEIEGKEIKYTTSTTKNIAKFLNEPLSFKAYNLFGSQNDNEEDLNIEYEPLKLSKMDEAILFKEIAKIVLKNSSNESIDNLIMDLKLKNKIPNLLESLTKMTIKTFIDNANELKEYILSIGDYEEIKNLNPISINEYTIEDNLDYVKIYNDNCLTYIPIKKVKYSNKDIIEMYVISLMDVLDKDSDIDYVINICPNKCKVEPFTLNSDEAFDILYQIFNEYNDYTNNKFFDFKLLDEKEYLKYKDDYFSLATSFNQNGFWQYFSDSRLFDKFLDLGYTDINYKDEIERMYLKQRTLFKFLRS